VLQSPGGAAAHQKKDPNLHITDPGYSDVPRHHMVGIMQWYSRQRDLLRVGRQLRKLQVSRGGPRVDAVVRVQRQVSLRLSSSDKAAMVEAYGSGIPTTTLCMEYHVSKVTVLKVLGQAGVQMRRQPMAPEMVAEACQLYVEGLSLQQVADRLDAPVGSVRNVLLRAGVTLRSPCGGTLGRKVRRRSRR
jgi:hypothetical protein